MNNLNQTLYFLRRDIERWYEEGVSVDYVKFEGELLWLDAESFGSPAALSIARWTLVYGWDPLADAHRQRSSMYEGRFAPEFGYEDWSTGWRERLHARYLDLAQSLVAATWCLWRLRPSAARCHDGMAATPRPWT